MTRGENMPRCRPQGYYGGRVRKHWGCTGSSARQKREASIQQAPRCQPLCRGVGQHCIVRYVWVSGRPRIVCKSNRDAPPLALKFPPLTLCFSSCLQSFPIECRELQSTQALQPSDLDMTPAQGPTSTAAAAQPTGTTKITQAASSSPIGIP